MCSGCEDESRAAVLPHEHRKLGTAHKGVCGHLLTRTIR